MRCPLTGSQIRSRPDDERPGGLKRSHSIISTACYLFLSPSPLEVEGALECFGDAAGLADPPDRGDDFWKPLDGEVLGLLD